MAQITGLFRIGRDAELRYTNSNEAVIGLSLAFNYYDKNAEKNRASQWIEAALFGKRAEALAQYLVKGGLVYATITDPHVEEYQKKDNSKGVKLTGRIGDIELAGGKPEGGQQQSSGEGYQPAPRKEAQKQEGGKAKPSFDDLDDDIPF